MDPGPAMRMAEGVQRQAVAFAAHVQAEGAVELLGLMQVGHAEHEAVDRMDRRMGGLIHTSASFVSSGQARRVAAKQLQISSLARRAASETSKNPKKGWNMSS
ncbi:hypothetical protein D3C85_1443120 [compost metagenome]